MSSTSLNPSVPLPAASSSCHRAHLPAVTQSQIPPSLCNRPCSSSPLSPGKEQSLSWWPHLPPVQDLILYTVQCYPTSRSYCREKAPLQGWSQEAPRAPGRPVSGLRRPPPFLDLPNPH